MNVKLPTEHQLEFLSLKGDCTGSSESSLVKMPHCWKSHVTAHMSMIWLHSEKFMKIHSVIMAVMSLIYNSDKNNKQ